MRNSLNMLIVLSLLFACGSKSNTNQSTSVKVDKQQIDLQEVMPDSPRKCIFTLTNTGEFPLVIYQVETSCGCTGAVWDKHPVKPGKSTQINITYLEKYPGRFYKTIKVLANVQPPLELMIMGEVVDKREHSSALSQ